MNRKKLKQNAKSYLEGFDSLKLFFCIFLVNFINSSPMKIISDYVKHFWDTTIFPITSDFNYYVMNIMKSFSSRLYSTPMNISILFSILCIIVWLIGPVLKLSITKICLDFLEERKIKTSILFTNLSDFNLILESFILNFLIYFYLTLWFLLFIIPGFIKLYSYSMAFYVMADNPGISASEALRESKRLMDGHKLDLFILHLSFIGWHLLCVVTFGIMYTYFVPYFATTMAEFYQEIKSEKQFISIRSN